MKDALAMTCELAKEEWELQAMGYAMREESRNHRSGLQAAKEGEPVGPQGV